MAQWYAPLLTVETTKVRLPYYEKIIFAIFWIAESSAKNNYSPHESSPFPVAFFTRQTINRSNTPTTISPFSHYFIR